MASFPDQIQVAFLLGYLVALAVAFFKAAQHFYGWFINSKPPWGKLSPLVEGFTMFSSRYLTKEGVAERDKFMKWLAIFLIMFVVFFVAVEFGGDNAT